MNIKFTFVFICILLTACSHFGNDNTPVVTLQIDRQNYSQGDPISVTITNGLTNGIELNPCCSIPDFQYQRYIDGEWTPAGYCERMCVDTGIPMNPGFTRIDTLTAYEPGYQRLVIYYYIPQTSLADSIVSDPFWVQ